MQTLEIFIPQRDSDSVQFRLHNYLAVINTTCARIVVLKLKTGLLHNILTHCEPESFIYSRYMIYKNNFSCSTKRTDAVYKCKRCLVITETLSVDLIGI